MWYKHTIGGMGSPARLLGPAYRPGLVPIVFGINPPPVPRRKIRREVHRTAFCRHRLLRVCPSLLLQSDYSIFTSRLKHRHAASLRSEYLPSSVRSKIRRASIYRFNAAAMTRVSVGLPSFVSPSEISAAVRGFFAALRMAWTWNGILSCFKPVALRRRFFGTSSPSFFKAASSSLIFFLWSSIARRITWAASLMESPYPNIEIVASQIPLYVEAFGFAISYGIGCAMSSGQPSFCVGLREQ